MVVAPEKVLATAPLRVSVPAPIFVRARVLPAPPSEITPEKELVVSASPMASAEAPVTVLRMMAPAAATLETPLRVSLKPFSSKIAIWFVSAPLKTKLPLPEPFGIWSLAPSWRTALPPVRAAPKSIDVIEVLPMKSLSSATGLARMKVCVAVFPLSPP